MLHIDVPTRSEIERLAGFRGSPAVSLYLPTTPLTQDVQADRIALKNLLKSAVAEMEGVDTPKRAVRAVEDAVGHLVEDDDFWAEQANSLAIFATPEAVRTFRLPNKLAEGMEVADRFHLKPLLRSVTFPHHAWLLVISMGAVRLVEVSADMPPHEVKVPGLPRNAADALGRRSHIERKGDMLSGESTSEHASMTRYARAVDQALRPVLSGHERPLIIVAAEPLASLYRAVCSYPHLAPEAIPGSADHSPDHELAAAARSVLDRVYAGQVEELGTLYAARASQGRATNEIATAARAATFGAIDTLVVDMDADLPGTVADEDGAVTFAEKADGVNYSVTDEITRRALLSGARVVSARAADIPGGGALAAILRYPV
ncbi:hypothetical protein [Enterovirga sp.]|uniref:baeRF11 domain-containing protein n=1 Tax=Enterovirga sp. TaxID=2026350 RepID=UPI002B762F78|nr:hypothetical protein [Enterovirga sp.]HMO28906.1 hypothetical protein [Enterovirga sp.]